MQWDQTTPRASKSMQIYSSRASEELYNEDFWLRAQSFSKRGKRDAKQPAKVRRRQLRPSLLLALLSIKFIVLVSGSKTNIVKDYSFRRIRGGEDDAPERKIWGLFQFKNELLSEVDAEDPYRGGALVVMNQRTLPDLESLQEVAAPALLLSTPVRNESKAEETEKQDSIWWSSAWSSQLPVDEENDVAGEAESETSGDGDELRLDELSSELERVTTSDSTLSTTEISSDEVTEQSKWEEDLHDGDSSDIEEYTRRVYADTPTGPGASNNETTKVVEQEEVADSPFISSGWVSLCAPGAQDCEASATDFSLSTPWVHSGLRLTLLLPLDTRIHIRNGEFQEGYVRFVRKRPTLQEYTEF